MNVCMFPGQGSQRRGMGKELFAAFSEEVKKVDEMLGYSIEQLCLEDPKKQLNKTQFTQVALYVVGALAYFHKQQQSKQSPDFVIGHSLGEFNALLAAGCFDFEIGLKLVKKRAELMAEADGGGMAAVLNISEENIKAILKEHALSNIDIANHNGPTQVIISGLRDEINTAYKLFQEGDSKCVPLNASGAFHSRFMQPSRDKFKDYLQQFEFSDPVIPVISNVTAEAYTAGSIVENLSAQITNPVRWYDSIRLLCEKGARHFEELGSGEVLTKMLKHISQQDSVVAKALALDEAGEEAGQGAGKAAPRADAVTSTDNKLDTQSGMPKDVYQRVNEWNRFYPIGSRFKVSSFDSVLVTKSEAVVLFGHRAAVYMQGYNGYFALDEMIPA